MIRLSSEHHVLHQPDSKRISIDFRTKSLFTVKHQLNIPDHRVAVRCAVVIHSHHGNSTLFCRVLQDQRDFQETQRPTSYSTPEYL